MSHENSTTNKIGVLLIHGMDVGNEKKKWMIVSEN